MSSSATDTRDTATWVAVSIVALATWCLLLAGANWLPDGVSDAIVGAARSLTAAVFLVAGVARLATWRVSGLDRPAYAGAILLVMGTALPISGLVDSALHLGRDAAPQAGLSRLVVLVPVLGVSAFAATTRRRPSAGLLAAAVAAGIGAAAVTAGLVVGLAQSGTAGMRAVPLWIAVQVAAAGSWIVLAVVIRGRRAGGPNTVQLTSAALLLAAGEVATGWRVADPGAPRGAATGLQLAAAVLVVVASVSDVAFAFGTFSRRSREVAAELRDTRLHLSEIQQRERTRLHDARSAVLGMMGASALLAQPTVAGADRTRLRQMVNDELERLRDVLEDAAAEPISDFRLVDALGPVLLAHRLNGMTVEACLDGIHVLGRPHALATAVDNVLTNAQVHAPDARVAVVAAAAGTRVVLTIEDDGPGIPHSERARVLAAGTRGSTAAAPGSGLGLYSAAAAMAEQDGTLRVSGRAGGGTRIVITMPRGAPPAHSPAPAMAS